jgi:hypothetical protein
MRYGRWPIGSRSRFLGVWCLVSGVSQNLEDGIRICSGPGGADVCTTFVRSAPNVPVWAGEDVVRGARLRVDYVDGAGRSLGGEVGEPVLTMPLPSMPVMFCGPLILSLMSRIQKGHRRRHFRGRHHCMADAGKRRRCRRGYELVPVRDDGSPVAVPGWSIQLIRGKVHSCGPRIILYPAICSRCRTFHDWLTANLRKCLCGRWHPTPRPGIYGRGVGGLIIGECPRGVWCRRCGHSWPLARLN